MIGTENGGRSVLQRAVGQLTVVDVFMPESLVIEAGQSLKGGDAVGALHRPRAERGAEYRPCPALRTIQNWAGSLVGLLGRIRMLGCLGFQHPQSRQGDPIVRFKLERFPELSLSLGVLSL